MAVVMLNYEINKVAEKDPSSILAVSRNFEHQIFVQNQDGSQRRAVTAKRAYKDEPGSLHYLKTAGYILLGSILLDQKYTVRYDKIDLQTGQITTIRYHSDIPQHLICKDISPPAFVVENVLPSPDGSFIAYFYSPACFKATVEFFDAKTLTLLDRQQIEISGINEAVWENAEGLTIYSTTATASNNAWRLLPKMSPLSTSYH
jgi:Tol biopolymer transport system component